MQHPDSASEHLGRIRNATLLDTAELARLVRTASLPRAVGPADLLAHGHSLVLDLGNGALGAVVHVDVADGRATANLLVVDPSIQRDGTVQRMTSVAQALCKAYGYDVPGTTVEVAPCRRRPAARRTCGSQR